MKQLCRHAFRAAPERLQKVVVILPVFADITSTEPTGNGPPSTTQDHSENDLEEVLPTASVQSSRDKLTPVQYHRRQRPCSHRGAPSEKEWFLVKQFLPRTPVAA
jgi:hypothetical protein